MRKRELRERERERDRKRKRRCVQSFKGNSVNVYWHLVFTDHWPFSSSLIESASKVNLEYCHPWVLLFFLNDFLKFQSAFHHSIAPNLWRFWPRVSPAHACLFQPIVGRCSLQIKLCNFTVIWDFISLFSSQTFLVLTHLKMSICTGSAYCTMHVPVCACVLMVDERVSGASLTCSTACLRVSAQSVSQPNPSLSPSATTKQEDL